MSSLSPSPQDQTGNYLFPRGFAIFPPIITRGLNSVYPGLSVIGCVGVGNGGTSDGSNAACTSFAMLQM